MVITITDDFDLEKIANSGQNFRSRLFKDGTYRFITRENILYIKKISETEWDVSCSELEWQDIWIPYFDLERSYKQIRKKWRNDEFLRKASDEGAGIRVLQQDAWEMIVTFIISQRKSIPAIKRCVESLCKLYGKEIQTEREKLYTFPTPESIRSAEENELASCGLGYRLSYIQDAAAKIAGKEQLLEQWNELQDAELLAALKSIKGVGDKVANCIMLFAYGRTASAPVDTWINKVIEKKYNGINPFPAYGDTAGIAQQYIFYYSISHKNEF